MKLTKIIFILALASFSSHTYCMKESDDDRYPSTELRKRQHDVELGLTGDALAAARRKTLRSSPCACAHWCLTGLLGALVSLRNNFQFDKLAVNTKPGPPYEPKP